MKKIFVAPNGQVEQTHPTIVGLLALCQTNQAHFQSLGMEFEASVFQESLDWIKTELGDPGASRKLRLAAFEKAFPGGDSGTCP